jgi:major membrane immunogen (membrane-anchored lipoprotein)
LRYNSKKETDKGKEGFFMKIKFNFFGFLMFFVLLFTACNSKKESGITVTATVVKLLERIVEDDGTILVTLEYDEQNRLVKISEYRYDEVYKTSMITYNKNTIAVEGEGADETTGSSVSYDRAGNTITYSIVDMHGSPSYSYFTTMSVNNDDYIVTEETQWQDGFYLIVNYEYHGGKLVSITPSNDERKWYGGHLYQKFIYDDNKSPFYNDKTPKWLLQKLFLAGFSTPNDGLNNNITLLEYNYDGSALSYINYEYEFDSDGFPIKEISSFPMTFYPIDENGYEREETKTVYSTKHYIYRGEAYETPTASPASTYEEDNDGPGDDYDGLPLSAIVFAATLVEPYINILEGDLSEFAGVWVNGYGVREHLRSDGTFGDEEDQVVGGFRSGYENFELAQWSMASGGASYRWSISVYRSSFEVTLFPIGVDIMVDGKIIETDTTKVRIYAGRETPSSNADIFYRDE